MYVHILPCRCIACILVERISVHYPIELNALCILLLRQSENHFECLLHVTHFHLIYNTMRHVNMQLVDNVFILLHPIWTDDDRECPAPAFSTFLFFGCPIELHVVFWPYIDKIFCWQVNCHSHIEWLFYV